MRTFLLSLSFCLFAITTAFAQPANDSCANYIEIDITDASFDLMPYVSGPTEYTNENATGNPAKRTKQITANISSGMNSTIFNF